eukprot:115053_1
MPFELFGVPTHLQSVTHQCSPLADWHMLEDIGAVDGSVFEVAFPLSGNKRCSIQEGGFSEASLALHMAEHHHGQVDLKPICHCAVPASHRCMWAGSMPLSWVMPLHPVHT